MKIIHIIPSLSAAGAEILMANMAITAAQKGHDVLVCCLFPPDETWSKQPVSDELPQHCRVEILNEQIQFRFLRRPLLNNTKYRQLLSEFKPDVVHSHLYLAELMAHSFQIEGVRYVSHGHDNMHQLKKFTFDALFKKSRLTNLWERSWLVGRYRKVKPLFIAISKDVEGYLKEMLPQGIRNVQHLPNAIRTENFITSRKYGVPVGSFRLVSIASLVPKKNHTFLIDVVHVLRRRGLDVQAEVLGTGPLKSELEAKTKQMGLSDVLFFRGSVGDVPERLWDAHLYVHPAWYEPFGLVLLEAMASGLPVVSLDGYGNRELMKEGQNGFMLPQDSSAEEFADKIQYFIEKPEERERQGQWAAPFALEYDIERYVDRLLSLYKQP